jgi:hypothetical protein
MALDHLAQSAHVQAVYAAYDALVPARVTGVHRRDARLIARGAATVMLDQCDRAPDALRAVCTALLAYLDTLTTPTRA